MATQSKEKAVSAKPSKKKAVKARAAGRKSAKTKSANAKSATKKKSVPADWNKKLGALVRARRSTEDKNYARADADSIRRALAGLGPEDKAPQGSGGARLVFNIASVHIPAFVAGSIERGGRPYKNGYDTGKLRIGVEPKEQTRRERMDHALSCVVAFDQREIYYGAVELNGTGVRFYGDVCLVLATVPAETVILDRNSYDLLRPPLGSPTSYDDSDDANLLEAARSIAGRWGEDLPTIAALKVLPLRPPTKRRLTTGQISEGLLHDEDYIEVLCRGSFGADDLQEARLTAADVAREAHVLEQQRHGPMPSEAASLWVQQRRAAERALADAKVSVRIITESGRVKS